MLTNKPTETTTEVASGLHPAFVAEARKAIPALRWLRANWTYDRTDMGGMRDYRWRKDTTAVNYVSLDSGWITLYVGASGANYWVPKMQIENPEGQQAIDFLVVAGILPAQFASTACTYCGVAR